MGANESLAQKHEMYSRLTFFSTGFERPKNNSRILQNDKFLLFFEKHNKARTTFPGTNSKL